MSSALTFRRLLSLCCCRTATRAGQAGAGLQFLGHIRDGIESFERVSFLSCRGTVPPAPPAGVSKNEGATAGETPATQPTQPTQQAAAASPGGPKDQATVASTTTVAPPADDDSGSTTVITALVAVIALCGCVVAVLLCWRMQWRASKTAKNERARSESKHQRPGSMENAADSLYNNAAYDGRPATAADGSHAVVRQLSSEEDAGTYAPMTNTYAEPDPDQPGRHDAQQRARNANRVPPADDPGYDMPGSCGGRAPPVDDCGYDMPDDTQRGAVRGARAAPIDDPGYGMPDAAPAGQPQYDRAGQQQRQPGHVYDEAAADGYLTLTLDGEAEYDRASGTADYDRAGPGRRSSATTA